MHSMLYPEEPRDMKIVDNRPVVPQRPAPTPREVSKKKKVGVVRRTPKVERTQDVIQVEGSYGTSIKILVDFWDKMYERATGLKDCTCTRDKKMELMSRILDQVGDEDKVQRLVTALLTNKKAEWVNNKTLQWLSSASNRSYLAPCLIRTKTRTAEFRGERAKTLKFSFRK